MTRETGDSFKNAVRAFVEEAIEVLNRTTSPASLTVPDEEHWQRVEDGQFARTTIARPSFVALEKCLDHVRSLVSYETARSLILADATMGPQMGRLIGAPGFGGRRIDVDDLIRHLIGRMIGDSGGLLFDVGHFERGWSEIVNTLDPPTISREALAPLPGLTAQLLPIELNEGLVIDKLTDDEIRLCIRAAIFQAILPGFPFVNPRGGLGIRWTTYHQKLQSDGGEGLSAPPVDPGTFGQRHPLYAPLLMDDVLTALRLLKAGLIWCPGVAVRFKGWMASSGHSAVQKPRFPFLSGGYTLSETEVTSLKELWRVLSGGIFKQKRIDLSRLPFAASCIPLTAPYPTTAWWTCLSPQSRFSYRTLEIPPSGLNCASGFRYAPGNSSSMKSTRSETCMR